MGSCSAAYTDHGGGYQQTVELNITQCMSYMRQYAQCQESKSQLGSRPQVKVLDVSLLETQADSAI